MTDCRSGVDHNGRVATYTFGDDRAAVERLRLVAAAYEPASRTFLAANAPRHPPLALDLGCGPAFSTQLLREVCTPTVLIGIDSSPEFVQVARERLPEARFEAHDVTTNPLPGAPAGLIYARLLLAHVPRPDRVARGWLSQLCPGGIMLIEDLEDVVNPPGPLQRYEEISSQIVRSGGGSMYAGPALSPWGGETQRVSVRGAMAARIYLLNVRRWRRQQNLPVTEDQLTALEAGLARVEDDDHGVTVFWIVRQVAVRA